MTTTAVTSLICNGKLRLPCGEYTVAKIETIGLMLLGKRNKKVMLTYSPKCTVTGVANALVFSIHDNRRNIATYAVTTNGQLLEVDL